MTKPESPPAAPSKELPENKGTAMVGGGMRSLVPKNFEEAERIARLLATSDIVPKEMIGKPANVLLCIMFGTELGLSPAQALQNVMVVNGRPSLWGDAVMGLVLKSGLCESWKDGFNNENGGTAWFTVKRIGQEPITRYFSVEDAKAARLWGNQGPWSGYPKRMQFHRARAWALRDAFPDVLKGMRYHEEERDVVNLERNPTTGEYQMPGRKSAAPAPASAPETAAGETTATAQPEATPLESESLEKKAFTVIKKLVDKETKKTRKLGFVIVHEDEPKEIYATLVEEVFKYIKETTKAGKSVKVEWEQGIGQRDIVTAIAVVSGEVVDGQVVDGEVTKEKGDK